MITIIKNLPEDIVGFRFEEEITAIDYETVLFPMVEAATKKSKELKVLCQLDDKYKAFSLGALKDDMEMGWKYFRNWEKIAFVSDNERMSHLVKAFAFLVPAKVKVFENKDLNEAVKWLEEEK